MLSSPPVASDLYKWSDADGTHYGDIPPEPGQAAQRLVIDECTTAACAHELERRREDTVAAYRELEAWLDRRAAQRAADREAARIVYRPVPVYIPGSLTVIADTPLIGAGHRQLKAHRNRHLGRHRRSGRHSPASARGPRHTAAREPLSVR
ncbi:MAG: DUF4124 domain-containing protein [Gammaproteobacteria bacterium]|nr:DUF4124 domain-containing protein [Gammaproteobacteria bacterium]